MSTGPLAAGLGGAGDRSTEQVRSGPFCRWSGHSGASFLLPPCWTKGCLRQCHENKVCHPIDLIVVRCDAQLCQMIKIKVGVCISWGESVRVKHSSASNAKWLLALFFSCREKSPHPMAEFAFFISVLLLGFGNVSASCDCPSHCMYIHVVRPSCRVDHRPLKIQADISTSPAIEPAKPFPALIDPVAISARWPRSCRHILNHVLRR